MHHFCIYILLSLFLSTAYRSHAQPYGLEERIPNSSLLISTSGDTLAEMQLESVFTNLSFRSPVCLTFPVDDTNRLFVVEKQGRIHVFQNDPFTAVHSLFLDISAYVNSTPNEAGLLGLAFHPSYASNGKFYVYYTYGNLYSRISEFSVSANPDSADEHTERILLEVKQPYSNHNGGQLAFGPDGYLYIGLGDGGSGGDPDGNGQNTQTLLGSILRIDVNTVTDTTAYGIPEGNPFHDQPLAGCPEIWAWGLRNPWRFSFDPENGNLWAGDVGQNAWEEIDLIEGGKNYGWNIMEGFHCYATASCDTTGLTLPVLEYDHNEGKSVTGGFVYRGHRLDRLYGVYLYGDYVTRKIWGLKYENGIILEQKLIAQSPSAISGFGQDAEGEVYVIGYDGKLYRFREKPDTPPVNTVPQSISVSGLYSDMTSRTLSPGLIPYSVNIPFWSDDAFKERIIALPDTSQIVFSENGYWLFQPEAVIVKNFYIATSKPDPSERMLVETRFLVRYSEEERWDGYSYYWDDAGEDAYLLDTSAVREITVQGFDSTYIQKWYYPSPSECIVCHTPAAGHVLGLRTVQMNKLHRYDTVDDNQLRSLNHIRLFTAQIGEDYSGFPRFPDITDTMMSLEQRARAYLDVNCGYCHLPGGTGRTNMDLRYETPLDQAYLLNEPADLDHMGFRDPYRILAGQPDSSVVYLRMTDPGAYRMPPLATFLIDSAGSELVRQWIVGLGTSLILEHPNKPINTFFLYQAYPNPFNSGTTVRFYAAEEARVSLTLFTIRGEKVRTLMNRIVTPGFHVIPLDAGELSTGIYVYSMQAPGYRQSRKCILIK